MGAIFDMEKYHLNGFHVSIINKPAFDITGFTAFAKEGDGSIHAFLQELEDGGRMQKLVETLDEPQQIWVCLSGNEGYAEADFRCTVCVERTKNHDFSHFSQDELFTLHAPESAWAVFEVGKHQSPQDLHRIGVYHMIGEIGYRFNSKVGFHLDNEHEWVSGKPMYFYLPVIKSTES